MQQALAGGPVLFRVEHCLYHQGLVFSVFPSRWAESYPLTDKAVGDGPLTDLLPRTSRYYAAPICRDLRMVILGDDGGEGQGREKRVLARPAPLVLQTHTQALTWVFHPLAQRHRPPSSYQRHFTPLYTALLYGWKHMKRRRCLARLQ